MDLPIRRFSRHARRFLFNRKADPKDVMPIGIPENVLPFRDGEERPPPEETEAQWRERIAREAAEFERSMAEVTALAAEVLKAAAAERESRAAEMIAHARAEGGRFHCKRQRAIILESVENPTPHVAYCRCEQFQTRDSLRGCEGCRQWRIYKETVSATHHFHQAEGLYEAQVSEDNLPAFKRWVNRRKGQYHATRVDCAGTEYYVVTSVRHPDSIPVTPQVAAASVRTYLGDYDLQARPVSTSRGWKLPRRQEQAQQYRRVGMACRFLTRLALRKIADELECTLNLVRSDAAVGDKIVSVYQLDKPHWDRWDRASLEYVYQCLMAGEVVPEDFDLELAG